MVLYQSRLVALAEGGFACLACSRVTDGMQFGLFKFGNRVTVSARCVWISMYASVIVLCLYIGQKTT